MDFSAVKMGVGISSEPTEASTRLQGITPQKKSNNLLMAEMYISHSN
jgi:hypothetical protein